MTSRAEIAESLPPELRAAFDSELSSMAAHLVGAFPDPRTRPAVEQALDDAAGSIRDRLVGDIAPSPALPACVTAIADDLDSARRGAFFSEMLHAVRLVRSGGYSTDDPELLLLLAEDVRDRVTDDASLSDDWPALEAASDEWNRLTPAEQRVDTERRNRESLEEWGAVVARLRHEGRELAGISCATGSRAAGDWSRACTSAAERLQTGEWGLLDIDDFDSAMYRDAELVAAVNDRLHLSVDVRQRSVQWHRARRARRPRWPRHARPHQSPRSRHIRRRSNPTRAGPSSGDGDSEGPRRRRGARRRGGAA
jgi:hypothetical protein